MNNKLFVGDSNVYIFSYFTKYGVKVIKYKGSPIKGIVNKNEIYQKIIENINKFKPTDLFLVFGIVDLNFYYYFKKYTENKEDIFEDIKEYVKEYVKIVSEMNVKNKNIIGILPSAIKDRYFRESLQIYGIISKDTADKIPKEDLLMVNRNKRTEIINSILEEECKKYNINFCNIFSFITKDHKLVKLFSLGKIGTRNIHHRYEYLLIVFIKTCLNYLIKGKNLNSIIDELKIKFNNYIKDKIYVDIKKTHTNKTKEEKDKLYKQSKFSKKKITKFINII